MHCDVEQCIQPSIQHFAEHAYKILATSQYPASLAISEANLPSWKKNNYDSSLKQIDCSNCSLEYNFIISTNLHLIWISKDGKMKQNVLLPCDQNVCKTWNNNKSIFLYLKWTDMTCSMHTNSRLLAHLCFTLYFVKNNNCEQEKTSQKVGEARQWNMLHFKSHHTLHRG